MVSFFDNLFLYFIDFILNRNLHLLTHTHTEIKVQDTSEAFNDQFFSPLQALVSQSRSSKVMAKKVLDNLDDLTGKSLTLKSEFLSQFKMCYTLSMKLTEFSQEVFT